MNVKKYFFLGLIFLAHFPILAQQKDLYQSKIADLGDINLQYMDFGGTGPTLIWIQDFHNYFEGRYRDTTYFHFFKELARDFHVLAPIRRGYGKSTDTKWGYDVATQANDLLRFMDVMGIEKAVLFGRIPATQDMTWIAEHHPEKVLGLIYDGNPILISGSYDPIVIEFVENWSILGLDFEKEKQKAIILSRLSWEPHFLYDSTFRINIPALRFIDNKYNWPNPNLGVLESGFLEQWIVENTPGREEELSYLRSLLQDTLRLKQLHQTLLRSDKSKTIDVGMQRVFGNNLQTIEAKEIDVFEIGVSAYLQWKLQHMRSFIQGLKN
jgi:pimeloyl-ACP methyl ester carboxylesterase